jgi:predicted phosphodiesterase
MLAILYDIHGNLPALEAVLKDIDALGVEQYLLGGDYGAPSPWPLETLKLLRSLPNATWIRGNGERWLKEIPTSGPHGLSKMIEDFLKDFPAEEVDKLYNLPPQAEIDGVLYVHGSPLADDDSFAPKQDDNDKRLLDGVKDKTVVFGHSHQQFQRPGPHGTYLVNPGSAGMPLDGDNRAGWAIRTDDGKFEFHRSKYDVQKSAEAFRETAGEMGEWLYNRLINGKD